jgi:hypothetical protein
MTFLIVSGASSPTDCNGVYSDDFGFSYGGVKAYKHITKNYMLWYDDPEWYISVFEPDFEKLVDYFFLNNSTPFGTYANVDGTGTVVVKEYSGSPAGTTGTAILKTDYIDKAYMGEDGEAVDVS